jgi:hypothetical protein
MPQFVGNSVRWSIFNTMAAALEQSPELQGVPVRRNPTSAIAVKGGDLLVVVRWNADTLVEAPGGKERRQFRLLIGSIANTRQPDCDADALHQVVGEVARRAIVALNAGGHKVKPVEREVTPDLDSLLIEGALVLSVWEIEYEKPRTFFQSTL